MEMDASWVFVAKESTKSSVQITFVCFLLLFIVIISTKDKLSLDVLCNKFHDKRGFLLCVVVIYVVMYVTTAWHGKKDTSRMMCKFVNKGILVKITLLSY